MSQLGTLNRDPGVPRTREARAISPRRRRDTVVAYLLLTPALLLAPGLLAFPISLELWWSLTNRSAQNASAMYIGLLNYLDLFADPTFWTATRHTVVYFIGTAGLKLLLGLSLALALARPFRGRPVVLLIAFLPWAYPAGIGLIGWSRFAIPPVHTAYSQLVANLSVFVDSRVANGAWGLLSLVAFNVWRGGSFTGILLFAALRAFPREFFDLVELDASSGWRRFWMATLPLLRPYLALATFLSFTTAVADLGNVWFLTGRRDAYPILWNQSLHHAIIGGQWGMAAALSLILLPFFIAVGVACYRFLAPLEEDPA